MEDGWGISVGTAGQKGPSTHTPLAFYQEENAQQTSPYISLEEKRSHVHLSPDQQPELCFLISKALCQ